MNSEKKQKKVFLAQPRGFCAGVDRAIEIVECLLSSFGKPIYVKHEIVHNDFVVETLKSKGAIFIEDLDLVPNGSYLVFSAHGVSKKIKLKAKERSLKVFDATCPLVTKVHIEVEKMRSINKEVIMIGHAGHPEVEGTMGQCNEGMYLVETVSDVKNLKIHDPDNLAYVTQTTLSVEDTSQIISELKNKFPKISEPRKSDICYATTNRQQAVKLMASKVDVVIVVGSVTSSNSNRLKEVAQNYGVESHMVDNANQIQLSWLKGKEKIGVTAGASAPEVLVEEVVTKLNLLGVSSVSEIKGVEENIIFSLPKGLLRK
tara:strand:+ start:480 stop:1427 length:948 start_codon:yes stop_codon:yes gene_type:complete